MLFYYERNKNKNKIISSCYSLESCDMWHEILEHMNYISMQRLVNFELLPIMILF